ncbi:MAG: AsmA-like C-terminal region-containing protein, partial [Acidobacteriota bacterium]
MKKIAIALLVLLLVLVGGAWVAVRVLLAPERVRAAVEAQVSEALGEQVRIGSASARIFPAAGLNLNEITIANTRTRLESVAIETGLRPLFSRRVENAQVTVSKGHVEIPWLVTLLSSLAQTPPSTAGSSSGFTVISVRTIELRDVVLAAGKHELRVDADGLYQEDRLEVSRLDAKGDGTAFTARGALASVSRVTGLFSIDADTLNLDALLALASAASPKDAPRAARQTTVQLSIDAAVKARSGRGATIAFSDLSTHMRVTPTTVYLAPVSLQSFDGRFTGRVTVDTRSAVPATAIVGDMSGIDAAALSAFAGSPGAVSGRLAGHASVSCACVDLQTVRTRMTGTGRFEIVNGEIPGLHMVRAIVLAFGRPASDAPKETGEHFSRIAATFTVGGGTIATHDLAFASPDFDMRGDGTLSTTSGAIDFKADVVLSAELSRQAGTDLVRYAHEGDRVILPATLSGTLASPRVFINLQEAIGRALKNELERRGRALLDRFLRKKPGGP